MLAQTVILTSIVPLPEKSPAQLPRSCRVEKAQANNSVICKGLGNHLHGRASLRKEFHFIYNFVGNPLPANEPAYTIA
jgi:hypothetical protein